MIARAIFALVGGTRDREERSTAVPSMIVTATIVAT
jgi:hypothetical protein